MRSPCRSAFVRDPSGAVVKDPNLEVQERLELLFEAFLKVRTVAKVMREFNDRDLKLPRRDRHGDPRWTRATTSAVAAILKNPAYAGASSTDGYDCTNHRTEDR
ncbi:recombinase family protein [Bradyrhizobium cosmicum]|uniref:recombinase family protein n=1 Tax=Bradyrhizobium cosmicum TaxID=1404864 RepID=UPI0028EA0141|nr:recombinase family protein [Bradyrhizobium cosmicum]